jgi:polysaccharide export outer membrane protein
MQSRRALKLALLLAATLSFGSAALADVAPAPVAAVAADPQGYRLGAGDKIRVIVFDEEALTGEYFVGDSGLVSLPLIGEIHAAGKTLGQFRAEVESAFRNGYLKDPKVSVEVLNYRPFFILGEVNKPGQYPYMSGLTVLNAVATAEGFTYRANTRVVFIKHANENAEHKERLDSQTPVLPGDTVRISERFF